MMRYVCIAAASLLATGCQQQAEMPTGNDEPEVCGVDGDPRYYNHQALDPDRDGVQDIYTEMRTLATTDYPSSAGSEELTLNAMDGNGVLVFSESETAGRQDIKQGMEIGPKPPVYYNWSGYAVGLSWKRWSLSGGRDSLWSGPAVASEGRFFGVRIASGAGYRYGWVRLKVDAVTGILKIEDHALNPVPDAPIGAGMKP